MLSEMAKKRAETPQCLHKKRPQTSSVFDEVRKQTLVNSHCRTLKEKDNAALSQTQSVADAKLASTYQSIGKGIARLHELGDRNWSILDFGRGSQPRTPATKSRARSSSHCFTRIPSNSKGSQYVRVFSPEVSSYVETPAKNENLSQKLTYISICNSNYASTLKVCGAHCNPINQKPFDQHLRLGAKPYTVSAETVPKGWAPQTRPQTTCNYESSRFNIINHTQGSNGSITKMIQKNPWACHRVKSISEYSDLGRRTATQPNRLYNEKLHQNFRCFSINSGFCSKQFELAHSYGPHFKAFGK